jgi:predicted protein tyrosine phosphatase
MTRLLFICGKARMRSATAADIFAGQGGIETDFAGLSNDADERLSSEHIEWADIVFVMEQRQKKRLSQLFSAELKGKKVACLNIPDRFEYMQPELVEVLTAKLAPYLRRYSQP